jgi:hypothetical protein
MKPGYKIIIVAAIVFGVYSYFTQESVYKDRCNKVISKLITDLRREDYFAVQNSLDFTAKQNISIDEIKEFSKDLNFTRDTKFVIQNIEQKGGLINVEATILAKNRELPLNLSCKDNNGTLLILNQKVGAKSLKPKKLSFPIASK